MDRSIDSGVCEQAVATPSHGEDSNGFVNRRSWFRLPPPAPDSRYLQKLAEKLDLLVDRSGGPDACHPWTGGFTPDGYGRLYSGNLDLQAHRCALEVKLGRRLAPGEVARHKVCDNRTCCNGLHLRHGSIADNNRDMVEHGRIARGDRSGAAKITEVQAQEILSACAGEPPRGIFAALGRRLGISSRQVSYIAKGQRRRAA